MESWGLLLEEEEMGPGQENAVVIPSSFPWDDFEETLV